MSLGNVIEYFLFGCAALIVAALAMDVVVSVWNSIIETIKERF
jgi:hypothetical protein